MLDEPFNNLDQSSIDRLNNYLQTKKQYLFITSHIPIDYAIASYQITNGVINYNIIEESYEELENSYQHNDNLFISKPLLKALVKSTAITRRMLYIISCIVIPLMLIALFNTYNIYNRATIDMSNFVFSNNATLITAPIFTSYFPIFGSEKWFEDIPTYFTDDDIETLKSLDYVTKVIPTKNRAYNLGGILYEEKYEIDKQIVGSEMSFTTSLYPREIAKSIPENYFVTNDGSISKMIAGSFAEDNSNQVMVDKVVADYIVSETSFNNYNDIIDNQISVPVRSISNNEPDTLEFTVSGVFEVDTTNSNIKNNGTIVTSFDSNSEYVQEAYSQYQDEDIKLENVKSRMELAGLSQTLADSDVIPSIGYDVLFVEVESEEDLEKLTNVIHDYNQYIEVENNFVNSQTVNFKYLTKIIYKNIFILFLIIIVYIVLLSFVFRIFKLSVNEVIKKLNFWGYGDNQVIKYTKYEIKEYLMNIVVLNLILSIIIQYFIINNFSMIMLLVINIVLFILNYVMVKYFVKFKEGAK